MYSATSTGATNKPYEGKAPNGEGEYPSTSLPERTTPSQKGWSKASLRRNGWSPLQSQAVWRSSAAMQTSYDRSLNDSSKTRVEATAYAQNGKVGNTTEVETKEIRAKVQWEKTNWVKSKRDAIRPQSEQRALWRRSKENESALIGKGKRRMEQSERFRL